MCGRMQIHCLVCVKRHVLACGYPLHPRRRDVCDGNDIFDQDDERRASLCVGRHVRVTTHRLWNQTACVGRRVNALYGVTEHHAYLSRSLNELSTCSHQCVPGKGKHFLSLLFIVGVIAFVADMYHWVVVFLSLCVLHYTSSRLERWHVRCCQ